MVACERCQSELPADAVFCTRCGRRAAASWSTPRTGEVPAVTDVEPASGPGNPLSTVAVFLGVVALLNLLVGVAGLTLAVLARLRREPSSNFAIVVATCGIALGAVLRIMVFDHVNT